MKNLLNRKLVVLFVTVITLLSFGCAGELPPNNQNQANRGESNDSKGIPTIACTQDAIIMAARKSSKAAADNIDNRRLVVAYPENSKVKNRIHLSGTFVGHIDDFRSFIDAIDQFRGPDCARRVVFQGLGDAESFRWCPDAECKPLKTDSKCNFATMSQLFKDSKTAYEFNEKKLYFDFTGQEGTLKVKGKIGDWPGTDRFLSLIDQLKKGIGQRCIATIPLTNDNDKSSDGLLNRSFEWTICEWPKCEEMGLCVDCKKFDTNTNTNTGGNANSSNGG